MFTQRTDKHVTIFFYFLFNSIKVIIYEEYVFWSSDGP